jgi:hypothetical protein
MSIQLLQNFIAQKQNLSKEIQKYQKQIAELDYSFESKGIIKKPIKNNF